MDKAKSFGFYLDRTLKKITESYHKVFKANQIGLTVEQWAVLQRIYHLGDHASQSEIANTSYRNRATTSRLINGLSKKGLVQKGRFNGDLKRYKLTVTKEGQLLVKKILPLVQELKLVGYQNIKEEEIKVFLKVLNHIWENYDNT